MTRFRRATVGLLAVALTGGVLLPLGLRPAEAAPPAAPPSAPDTSQTDQAGAAAPAGDRTSAKERRRVDRVKTPKLRWYTCFGGAKCAQARLPRDYDQPDGAKVTVALLKRPATGRKIGTLFVNPGGPGGSGTEMAFYAPILFGEDVLASYDVVGVDPRGTNFSTNLKCSTSTRKATQLQDAFNERAFPYGTKLEKRYRGLNTTLAKRCSTTGKPLSGAISTAEVARDHEVLRRAVGDTRFNYMGVSYGTYLGQVYANLFPDRVGRMVIDGVLDPNRWSGRSGSGTPIGDRLRSADGASKALQEIFRRCDRAGTTYCSMAGNSAGKFALVAQRLKQEPLSDVDPISGQEYTLGYPEFVGLAMSALYTDFGGQEIDSIVTSLLEATAPAGAQTTKRAAAVKTLATVIRTQERRQESTYRRQHLGFPYPNFLESLMTISCTDSKNRKNLSSFGRIGAAADRRAPYFGRLWLWNQAACSSPKWKVADEDAYRGRFTHRTASPVLVLGNYWDPATNYAGARAAASLLPNSRLLSSNSWGHTAYQSSECATSAVDTYLVSGTLPAKGRVCQGENQPFTTPLDDGGDNGNDTRTLTKLGLLRPPTALNQR